MESRALVLGGGGSTGFAWQWGLLTGLHDSGVRLGGADLLVGTSAGAAAAVELAATSNPRELLAFMMSSSKNTGGDPGVDGSLDLFNQTLHRLASDARDATELRAGIGAMALAAETAPESTFRQIVTGYIRGREWPKQRVRITAVDAHSGQRTVFDPDSGVPVIDAVAASCAVPGVWAPISIGESHYIDGTVQSPTNADLAAGYDRVLVIAPVPELPGLPGATLAEQLAPVEAEGRVTVLTPDDGARGLIGSSLMDLSQRPSITQAGLDQGRSLAGSVGEFWG